MTGRAKTLNVYIAGAPCGQLTEDRYGRISFEYDPNYCSVPLSLSMPVGLERYGDRIVRPYLMGLLPDEASTRTAIGAKFGISGNNPFRLLEIVGFDCPGAVQICRPNVTLPAESDAHNLIELSDGDIEKRLAAVRHNAAAAWSSELESEGHWSLAGCQAKFALRAQDGRWFECAGAATTHIMKPGVVGLGNQALVEYLSMKTAGAVKLPVAEVDHRMFGPEPAIIVKRYDRMQSRSGKVLRIHQEDFCQALSISPDIKYADQGGPTTPQIIGLLKATGKNARENVYRFVLYLFFNYLVGATDAHAKNHSVLFVAPDDIRLAPLYDVASIAPYQSIAPTKRKPIRAALSIGGENRFGMLKRADVEKMVADCRLDGLGLGANLLCEKLATMAHVVPDALRATIDDAQSRKLHGISEVAGALQSEIEGNCKRTLSHL